MFTNAQTAGFSAPDTVCVGSPVQLQNTSTGITSYFWNFCSGSIYSNPELSSLGNLGGLLKDPVFTAIAKDGDNYYVFVINNTDDRLVRLDFGTSLLNNPVGTQLGNISIPSNAEGVQVVQDAAGWHIIVVGGTALGGSRVVTIDFGASLANNAPVGTDWGNIGNMAYPIDLYVFEDGGKYYGFTCNSENNTITRLDFGDDFTQPPTGINLGNLGGVLNAPTGIFAIQENGNWHLIVTNERDSKLIRLDFGPSLLNTAPAVVDLGNPGTGLNHPRDISLIRECGQIMAIAVNGREPGTASGGAIGRFVFHGGITGNVTGEYLGNPGNLFDLPHAISSIFRVDNELYAFVPNARNGTLTRMSFESCTDASIPSSTSASPPVYQYNRPGRYTINLITDEGTATQQTACRNIVVVEPPAVDLGPEVRLCDGSAATLDAGDGFSTYSWSDGSTGRFLTASTGGTYAVTVTNGGCSATDEVELFISPPMQFSADIMQEIDCRHTEGAVQINISGGTAPFSYSLDGAPGTDQPVFSAVERGIHSISVTDDQGCIITDDFGMTEDAARLLTAGAVIQPPLCDDSRDGAVSVQVTLGTPPFEYALADGAFQSQPDFTGLPGGAYKVYVRNSYCIDSLELELTTPAPLLAGIAKTDEICGRGDGEVNLSPSGGTAPYNITWENNAAAGSVFPDLSAGTYHVAVEDANGCRTEEDVAIINQIYPNIRIRNEDITINIGEQVILQAENAPDYQWESDPVDGNLSCPVCATTIARPLRDTRYIVRTLTGQNCVPADTVNVHVTYLRSFFMPNAFSPNNDGQNDYFKPVSKGVMVFSMQLYNRWGELLFQQNDPYQGWDGKVNGQPQPVGTYVYVVTYGLYSDVGEIVLQTRKGTFTLVR
ncbi:T9SS type B sorting domain-containing protein [Chitinophaga cymbidii]|uniref:PKD domain-containing protein n=1 Tax=Chitinophaga cymbidii TaxID=1096750 RepID=A0A512RNL3_9BACT|nr:hypothetical protein CCY01nite_35480 [Chitinophaga cymbidii]